MAGTGRQGNWLARLCLVAFLAACLCTDSALGLDELISNTFKIIKDLPDLGRALKAAVKSTFEPVFQSRGARARSGGGDSPETHCFGELGCISISEDFHHPVHRPINLSPASREEIGVTFRIMSKEDPAGVAFPGVDVQKALGSSFKSFRKTKVVIHGFLNGRDMPYLEEIPRALLRNYDVNVIWVDWTDGSIALYNRAVANSRVVGLEVAHLINWLKTNMGLNPADVHIIGHSLGSHTAGYAGERIPGLGRITGLDPAEPFFQHMPTTVRLDPSDATLVDVIHTDSESILNIGQGYGLRQPIGHLDFYPNDGKKMPGCNPPLAAPLNWIAKRVRFTKVWHAVEDALGCNHKRAVEIFSDSIESQCPYMAFRCDSYEDYTDGKCVSCGANGLGCAPMGLHADAWSGTGRQLERIQLFTSTGTGPHYCRYHYQLSVELGDLPNDGSDAIGLLHAAFVNGNGHQRTFDLTAGRPKLMSSQGRYLFFLEHHEDLGDTQEALLKWVMSRGSRSRQTNLSLRKIAIRNVDTYPSRNSVGRSGGLPSTLAFCNDQGHSVVINDQGTARLPLSANCLTTG